MYPFILIQTVEAHQVSQERSSPASVVACPVCATEPYGGHRKLSHYMPRPLLHFSLTLVKSC